MKDVLILYEHRNRELENASLLASELEYRGYTVSIQCIYSLKKYFIKTNLVIVPHLYNDAQLISFGKNYWRNNYTIIDMQYEQILRKSEKNGIQNPKGQAVFAQHIAWGQAQKEAYLTHGIPKENIHVVGHIAMDLLRQEFDMCFIGRSDMAREFQLDESKKWVLFISTFAYKMMTKEELKDCEITSPGSGLIRNMSVRAQKIIMEWLIKAAKEHKDMIFIYRRHPFEREDPDLLELEKQIPNFRCIDRYSMRQWIRSADSFYTWYSTSIADAYFRNRMCYILRPEAVPDDQDVEIMCCAKTISDFDSFNDSLSDSNNIFPISDEVMRYFYGNDRKTLGTFAFIKIADLCEEVLHNKKYQYEFDYGSSRIDMHNYGNVSMVMKDYLYFLLFEICKYIKIPVPTYFQRKKGFKKIVYFLHEGYHSTKEIKQYKKKFYPIIQNLHKEGQK